MMKQNMFTKTKNKRKQRLHISIFGSLPTYWQSLQCLPAGGAASTGSSTTNITMWKGGCRWTCSWNDQLCSPPAQSPLSHRPNPSSATTFSRNRPTNSTGYPFSPKLLNLNTLSPPPPAPLLLFLPIASAIAAAPKSAAGTVHL